MGENMDNILSSIKKLLGIPTEETAFDSDIIMHINSVFMILNQLGIGPTDGFTISDDYALWSDFIPDGQNLELVKSYMYMKVRLMFDPPSSSAVLTAMEKSISEFEWRLNVQAETKTEETQNDE